MRAARNLCLHYVDTRLSRRLAITPLQLEQIVEREREARTPAPLVDGHANPDAFTLSFDDAHRSVLELAAPVLARRGVPATLFVATAWIDTTDEWMTWDGLRALRDLGWTIGAHSVTHPRMSWRLHGEDDSRYRQRLFDECQRSKELLGRKLGIPIDAFAYPYGEDPDAARKGVESAGFRFGFTVRESSDWDGNAFSIPRIEAMEAHGLVSVCSNEPVRISVVVPARDRSVILAETLARLDAQSYPRERFEVIVVDDGSREDLRRVIPPSFRFVESAQIAGPFRAGQTRARGAREAQFEVLAFLDADVAVGRDYLWALDWVHQRFERTALLGYLSGYNLHDGGRVHTVDAISQLSRLEDVPVILDRQREPVARACLDNVDWLSEPWRLCYTGNLSLPRTLFDEVGGFDASFEGWGLEDVDLGYRLHRAGAQLVFSRFALGYHMVDPDDAAPRNPFRRMKPTREDFTGYLRNLETLTSRHGDPAIASYVERTLADIDETCGRPHTVGIEHGGAAFIRPPFHRQLHAMQPGGVPTEELLDRVEYAIKVGAKRLWLCGGEPADHEGFLSVLEAAHRAGLKIGMQTMGHAFARDGLAKEARRLGLDHATILMLGGDAERHEALCGAGAWVQFALGMEALAKANIHRSARLVISPGDGAAMAQCEARLRAAGMKIEESVRIA